jgi:hypothetical protein
MTQSELIPLMETRYVATRIARTPRDVYAFASDPRNLPAWAAGLAGSVRLVDGEWLAESPLGNVRIRMAPHNELGVLDHEVTLATGESFHNPMRVMPNGGGSEVMFVVFRRAGVSAEAFAEDAATVQHDLEALKRLLEGGTSSGARV